jgi:hypothetical protein
VTNVMKEEILILVYCKTRSIHKFFDSDNRKSVNKIFGPFL